MVGSSATAANQAIDMINRTSDDFFPDSPDSHRFHIANNATTAFLDRKLSVTRDFDMFTTHHPLADYHALLRCFTTAPMYITDSEASDLEVFNRLGGLDVNGEYRIVKTMGRDSVRVPSTAFTDVTGSGDGPALKVALPVPSAAGVILGFWNCRGNDRIAVDGITKDEIEEAFDLNGTGHPLPEGYAVMYGADRVEYLEPLQEDSSSIVAPINLAPGTCKTISVVCIQTFSDFSMAVLGVSNKYVSLCSVLKVEECKIQSPKPVHEAPVESVESEIQPESQLSPAHQPTDSSEDTRVEPDQAELETAPLLPKARSSSAPRSGSRILALLLFYRRDLRHARATFFRDFWRSPFKTIFKEIRAALGGPSTLPDTSEDESTAGEAGPTTPAPEMQEATKATPKLYGTTTNCANGSMQHEGDRSVTSESSGTTAVDDVKDKNQVVIKLSVAGKLMLWIPGFAVEAYTITLQGQEVASQMIACIGDCVTIDMESAAQALSKSDFVSDCWQISISKK